jgi:hypothetical protein
MELILENINLKRLYEIVIKKYKYFINKYKSYPICSELDG